MFIKIYFMRKRDGRGMRYEYPIGYSNAGFPTIKLL